MAGATIRLEDVSEMSLEDCSDYLEREEIEYEHLVSLEEMQDRIRLYLEEKQGQSTMAKKEGDETEKSAQELLEEILAEDKKIKSELSEIYLALLQFISNHLDKEMRPVIEKLHGNVEELLERSRQELLSKKCPIVVTGETSAGKSTLLNLIIGTDILPHSLLHATSTICCLHNSENKQFEIIPEGKPANPIIIKATGRETDDEFKEKLKPYVISMKSGEQRTYKLVDIYWPIPMLQDYVTIVDTPGVGESEVINQTLLEYLPNAVAFIYVINSANAGGIQKDRLESILKLQKKWEQEGKLSSLDYTSTMFVCNKWDIVIKRQQEEEVWKDTLAKLTNILPNFPTDQVFKISAAQADRFRRSGMGNAQDYQQLLQGVQTLVPRSLKAKLGRHFKFLDKFIQQLISHVSSRINNASKTKEEKIELVNKVTKRMNKLEKDTEKVKQGLIETARTECLKMVTSLHEYLHTEAVKERLLAWREDEAPDLTQESLTVTKVVGEEIIHSRISQVLEEWEKEQNMVQKASELLTRKFKEDCRILDEMCRSVNLIIEGGHREEIGLPEDDVDIEFTRGEKVALAVSSPIWVPLLTVASILFVPFAIGLAVRNKIQASDRRKQYMKDKVKYMRKWTTEIIETAFTVPNIEKYIFEAYFKNFRNKIEELCNDFIPKHIAAGKLLVSVIENDVSTSGHILKRYEPLLNQLLDLEKQIQICKISHLSKYWIDSKEISKEGVLGHGDFSDMFLAIWRRGSDELKVALKILNRKTIMQHQLEEADILRKLKHPNVVEVFGLTYTQDIKASDGRLTLVMEVCETSLETKVFGDFKLQCGHYETTGERVEAFTFYVKMATGVCFGLAALHNEGYLHRDLKLSNVLVKNNTAKLCDLVFATHDLAVTDTLTRMSPEVLRDETFTYSSDIYSLGILLWELWYGCFAFTEPAYRVYTTSSALLEAIENGLRPAFRKKFCPIDELKELIEDCWNYHPTQRPKAVQVAGKLSEMFEKHHGRL